MISVGLIGCGRWGKNILRDLLSLGCDTHVVARSPESIARAGQQPPCHVYSSFEDMPPCDGYVIATPSASHYAVISQVLEASTKPIFVEKPLTTNAAHSQALAPYAGQIFVMDKWRYHNGVLKLKELIGPAGLGALRGIQSKRFSRGLQYDDGSTLWHLLPHDLSIVIELTGALPALTYAIADITQDRVHGVTAHLGRSPWIQLEATDRFEDHHREVRLFFDRHVAILSGAYADHIRILNADGSETVEEFEENMPLLTELESFVGYLGGGPAPKSDYWSAAEIVKRLDEIVTEGSR